MRHLRMWITGDTSKYLKVVWEEGYTGLKSYQVFREQVSGTAEELRAVLQEMSDQWKKLQITSGRTYSRVDNDATFSPLLRKLASHGADLHRLLFAGAAIDKEVALRIENECLYNKESNEEDDLVDLTITSDSSVHVPWGLVYHGDPRKLPTNVTTKDAYKGFWCCSFRMRTLFSDWDSPPYRKIKGRDNFRILFLHDCFELADIRDALTEDEISYLENRLWKYKVGPATDWDAGQDKWGEMQENQGVLYIFGHSNGTAFSLRKGHEDETITPAEFARRFEKTNRCRLFVF